MKEVGELMQLMAGTMHLWVPSALVVLWGILYGSLTLFAIAMQDR